jgi:hypothetical protein
MITDHNLSPEQLVYYGGSIKAGKRPLIPESEKAKLRPAIEEAKALLGSERHFASAAVGAGKPKWIKTTSALLTFVATYLLVSTMVFLIVLYFDGGSVFSALDGRAFGIALLADAAAGYLGVVAGRKVLDNWLEPYPQRFVGIAFIVLLAIWFIPLTLIYVFGGVAAVGGLDLGHWPPDGEFAEYFLGLVRAIVAVICTWVMLVKRPITQH